MNNKEKYWLVKIADEGFKFGDSQIADKFDWDSGLAGGTWGGIMGGAAGAGVGGIYGALRKKKEDESRLRAILKSMALGGGIGGASAGLGMGAVAGGLEFTDEAAAKHYAEYLKGNLKSE